MSGYKINLDDDMQIQPPFDLIFCGLRETVTEPGLLKLRREPTTPPLLPAQSLKLFTGGTLKYTGQVVGDHQFGVLRKADNGKIEIWLDPHYVTKADEARLK